MPEANWTQNGNGAQNGHGLKVLFVVFGVLVNLLVGSLVFYATRLSSDVEKIDQIARAGAANATLLARDVEHVAKWANEQIQELKERVATIERARWREGK